MSRRRSVVLIEKDPWVVDSLTLFFQRLEWDLRVFRAPGEALRELRGGTADVLLCDVWPPDGSSLSFLAALMERFPEALCILTTAYLPPATWSRAEELGIHELLQKPLTAPGLLKALAPVLPGRGV